LLLLLTIPLSGFGSDDRQLASGPFSISLRGGAMNDSTALGVDGRMDYLHRLLNIHLFGTVDILDSGRGQGRLDTTRYGGGLALSHTYAETVNAYVGASLTREMDKNFAQIYLGGKAKLTDYALLTASYGFGFDKAKEVESFASSYLSAEAVDWLKLGGTLVSGQGLKANAYYHLTDPAGQRISGVDGELSYAVLDNLSIGVNGSYDITKRAEQSQNWRSFVFVTYAFGGQKGSPISIALNKNNPVEYPQIIRRVVQKAVAPAAPPPPPSGPPLLPIFQSANSVGIGACGNSYTVFLKANGGVGPYVWTTNFGSGPLTSTTGISTNLNINLIPGFCGINQTIIITVTDQTTGQSQTATVTTFGV
jgi:hypothetical protein